CLFILFSIRQIFVCIRLRFLFPPEPCIQADHQTCADDQLLNVPDHENERGVLRGGKKERKTRKHRRLQKASHAKVQLFASKARVVSGHDMGHHDHVRWSVHQKLFLQNNPTQPSARTSSSLSYPPSSRQTNCCCPARHLRPTCSQGCLGSASAVAP
ncbi:unnamed protein product, partial [Ectocarpus sp. 6 AP-2014]